MPRLPETPPALVCPGCGARVDTEDGRDGGARFCPACRLPLVIDDPAQAVAPETVSDRHRRARMIKPQLAEGELVKVARASNQSEAEFIQGLLLEEGVPSLLRRSAGFDVPDMLAAGPRDVMVPAAGVATAREILLQSEVIPERPESPPVVAPGRLLAGLLVALAVGIAVIWLATLMIR